MLFWCYKSDSVWIYSPNAVNHRYCNFKAKVTSLCNWKRGNLHTPFSIPAPRAVLYWPQLPCLVYREWHGDLLPSLGEPSPDGKEEKHSVKALASSLCCCQETALWWALISCAGGFGALSGSREAGRVKKSDTELLNNNKSLTWYCGKHCGALA